MIDQAFLNLQLKIQWCSINYNKMYIITVNSISEKRCHVGLKSDCHYPKNKTVMRLLHYIKWLSYLSRILGAEELVPSSVEDDLRSRTREAFEPRLKINASSLNLFSVQELLKKSLQNDHNKSSTSVMQKGTTKNNFLLMMSNISSRWVMRIKKSHHHGCVIS